MLFLTLAAPGCGDDDDDGAGADAGADAAQDVPDAGSDAAADANVPDTGIDASVTPGGFGAACQVGEDCESGSCIAPAAAFDVGTGYCSRPCTSEDDCTGDPEEHEYSCFGNGDAARCVRSCDRGFGCTETEICLPNFGLPSGLGTHDVCLDLQNDRCDSDADCVDEFCLPLTDRETVVKACFAPRDRFGGAMELQPPGTLCDPNLLGTPMPCDVPADCLEGWDCQAPGPGLWKQCIAPPQIACSLLCLGVGLCSGLCEADGDCPADMACGRVPFALYTQGTSSISDDVFELLGICQYAAGSRTPCSAEDDCAATGGGGTRETCNGITDMDGTLSGECVTPIEGVGLPGDTCGDDPETDAIEPGAHCHGICFEGRCSGMCATLDDCQDEPGMTCTPVKLDATDALSFCVVRDPCENDADCSDGEVCQPFSDAVSLGGNCGAPAGTLLAGDTCKVGPLSLFPVDERCASGLCQDVGRGREAGTCSGPCASDDDCPTDHLCAIVDVTIDSRGTPDRADDVDAQVTRCLYLPGSRASCVVEADCGDGETCALLPVGDAVGGVCIAEEEGGRATGQGCGFALPCETTACVDGWYGTPFCTELCDEAGACPEGFDCRTFEDDVRIARNMCMPADDPRGTALP